MITKAVELFRHLVKTMQSNDEDSSLADSTEDFWYLDGLEAARGVERPRPAAFGKIPSIEDVRDAWDSH